LEIKGRFEGKEKDRMKRVDKRDARKEKIQYTGTKINSKAWPVISLNMI